MNNKVVNIFATPLLVGKSDNAEMRESICNLAYQLKAGAKNAALVSEAWDYSVTSSSQEDFDKSGVSTANLQSLIERPEWAEVTRFIYNMANDLIRTVYNGNEVLTINKMWTNIYPPGTFVPQHLHPNCILSGAFYAKAPKDCGNIIFQDPAYIGKVMHNRGIRYPTQAEKYMVEVDDGLMVIFPSWLPHSTQPNKSTEDRIILSFNLDFSDPEDGEGN